MLPWRFNGLANKGLPLHRVSLLPVCPLWRGGHSIRHSTTGSVVPLRSVQAKFLSKSFLFQAHAGGLRVGATQRWRRYRCHHKERGRNLLSCLFHQSMPLSVTAWVRLPSEGRGGKPRGRLTAPFFIVHKPEVRVI